MMVERGAQVGGQLENIRLAKRRMHGIKRREQLQPRAHAHGRAAFALDLGGTHHENVIGLGRDIERITRVQQAHGAVEADFGRIHPRHFAAHAAQAAWCGGFRRPVPIALCAGAAAIDEPVELRLQIGGFSTAVPMAGRAGLLERVGQRQQHLTVVELAFFGQV